jgi:hypothetical protein
VEIRANQETASDRKTHRPASDPYLNQEQTVPRNPSLIIPISWVMNNFTLPPDSCCANFLGSVEILIPKKYFQILSPKCPQTIVGAARNPERRDVNSPGVRTTRMEIGDLDAKETQSLRADRNPIPPQNFNAIRFSALGYPQQSASA